MCHSHIQCNTAVLVHILAYMCTGITFMAVRLFCEKVCVHVKLWSILMFTLHENFNS